MKKTFPLLITFAMGVICAAQFFVPVKGLTTLQGTLQSFASILAAAAFVLGSINLVQINVPLIQRRRPDWGYKVVMLAIAAITFLVGIKWHEYGRENSVATVTEAAALPADALGPEQALLVINADSHDRKVVKLDGVELVDPKTHNPLPLPITLKVNVARNEKGEVLKQVVTVADLDKRYAEVQKEVFPAPGKRMVVAASLTYLWGPDGQAYQWIYNHVFAACNATMFSLLAFFITSAAFRAFRMRNLEASLLLGAALLVMAGTVPIGAHLSHTWLSGLQEWILSVPTVAGRRAIMMGAALGAVAIGLRVILGLERSHLGGD